MIRLENDSEPELPKLNEPIIRLVEETHVVVPGGGQPGMGDVSKNKLTAPVIHLETVDEPGNVGETSSILGVGVLGKMILGNHESGRPKLKAPVIYLETLNGPEVPAGKKLATPFIYLETLNEPEVPVTQKLKAPVIYLDSDEPDEPDEPEVPVTPKLATPVIYLDTDEPEVPVTPKLATPFIYLETVNEPEIPDESDEPDEPDEPEVPVTPKLATPVIYLDSDEPEVPVIQKLATPVIYLETVNEPEIPDEPEVPVTPKLATPVIYLDAVQGPDIPVEPEITKLAAPEINIECEHEWGTSVDMGNYTVKECKDCGEQDVKGGLSVNIVSENYEPQEGEVFPVDIIKPNGKTQTISPTSTRPHFKLINLALGNYTVQEHTDEIQVSGYNIKTRYTVKLADEEPVEGQTVILTKERPYATVTITNSYTKIGECSHEYESYVTESTCTSTGYTTHVCSICNNTYTDNIKDALGHDWSEPYYSNEFTSGYGRKCNRCGELEVMQKLSAPVIRLVDTKLATPVIDIHDYKSVVVEPTCTVSGFTIHGCDCGDKYVDNLVDALGHDWGEPYKLGDEYVRDCARCGERETGAEQYLKGRISIEAVASGDTEFLNNQVLVLLVTPPDGFVQTVRLTDMYPNMNLVNTPLGEYTISAKAGYGWIDGYDLTVKYTVQYGDAEPVETNTIVLTPEERNPVVKVIYHYVRNDGEHVHTYADIVTNPTCAARGYTTHTCMCGDTYKDNYVNALGHDWSEPYYDGDEYVRVCNRCGARQSGNEQDVRGSLTMRIVVDGDRSIGDQGEYRVEITPPDGHKQIPIMGPSWTEANYIKLELGSYQFEALPEYSSVDGYNLTFKYSVDYFVSDPVESQVATLTPDVTNAVVTVTYHYEKIPDYHAHSYTSTVVEPTCSDQGYTLHSCACGDSYTDNFVDALGHAWGEPYKYGDKYVRDCARCGEQETGAEQYLRGNLRIQVETEGDLSLSDIGDAWIRMTRPDGKEMTAVLTQAIPYTSLISVPLGEWYIYVHPDHRQIEGYDLTLRYSVGFFGEDETIESQTLTLTPERLNGVVTVTYCYKEQCDQAEYTSVVTDPTCTEMGYTTYTCINCGDSYVNTYEKALGHDWSEPYYSDEFVTGYGRKCNRCGELEAIDIKLKTPVIYLKNTKLTTPVIDIHNYTSITTEPTCAEQGYTTHTCQYCGDVYVDNFVDALGHDWSNYVEDDYVYTRTCNRCGEQEIRGKIHYKMIFEDDVIPDGAATSYTYRVVRPDGRAMSFVLSNTIRETTIIQVPLGEYFVSNNPSNYQIDGYEFTTKYSVKVAGKDVVEGQYFTLTADKTYAEVTITNSYKKITA